jgi:predicted dehydrogenase
MRIAQYGTKHGHAEGKLLALRRDPRVVLAGVFEPDSQRRRQLEHSSGPFEGVHWFDDANEILQDPTIVAVASEGRNDESLLHTEQIIRAGKHCWYDKPAGENWEQWRHVVALAHQQHLVLQMGYMFRYHHGFRQIAEWVQTGLLGDIFAIRAHFSTSIEAPAREVISRHAGGIFYDLAGHMLDQIVWLLGRPQEVNAFRRNSSAAVVGFDDNTLGVFGFERALAFIDIAAMESPPPARRFEVFGNAGSAIMEPMEPAGVLRLCLREARDAYVVGEQYVPVPPQSRQSLYELELAAFVATILGEQPPERTLAHELLVQETLLRATGHLI